VCNYFQSAIVSISEKQTAVNILQLRPKYSEHELIDLCKKGERKAQKALFDQYSGKMMKVCSQYFNNEADAEDAIMTGFVKVFERLQNFRSDGSLEGWIRKIMVNTCVDKIRGLKYFDELNESVDSFQMASESEIESSFSYNEILTAIDSLPVGFKTVLSLYAIEGYMHREIAEMLHISENTSKTQYMRAKELLLKTLEKNNNILSFNN